MPKKSKGMEVPNFINKPRQIRMATKNTPAQKENVGADSISALSSKKKVAPSNR